MANKFPVGERVILRNREGEKERGRVTNILPGARRVVTDSGGRMKVAVRSLQSSPDKILILEGRLDRSLKSRRIYGPMLQQWFSAYGVEPLYERIHTIHDLEKFLHQEGRNVSTRFVHITCHGKDEQGCGTAKLCLTFDDVDLVRNADIFKGLDGKVIVFSCCQVGNDERAMLAVKEASGAAAIIGYRMSVKDSYANLAEVLLYDRLLIPHMKVAEAVKQVQSTLKWGEGTLSNSFILFSPFLFPHPR